MKTLSDHPLLISRLLEADAARRERRAARARFWRSPLTTLGFVLLLIGLLLALWREISNLH